jgi:hypothetical protein
VPLKAELNELEKTKFSIMYRMLKILRCHAFWKTGNFPYKDLFRQFPFNPEYLISFSAPK